MSRVIDGMHGLEGYLESDNDETVPTASVIKRTQWA
jgi:hypothetical protein